MPSPGCRTGLGPERSRAVAMAYAQEANTPAAAAVAAVLAAVAGSLPFAAVAAAVSRHRTRAGQPPGSSGSDRQANATSQTDLTTPKLGSPLLLCGGALIISQIPPR